MIRKAACWGWLALLAAALLITRLCHVKIVWVEEGYPTAAALQLLRGKSLYSQIWFDKPPLFPYLYLLWGVQTGWPLRVAGALFVFACCLLIGRFATSLWTPREGLAAALLLGFYLTFGIPSAVMPLAPDLLMVAPHIAAIWLAWRGRAFAAGFAAGVGLLLNSKAVFVLAACIPFVGRSTPLLLTGFALPNLAAFAWFGRPYYEEVWRWGAIYSAHGFASATGVTRTLNWIGFQATAVAGAAWCLWRERRWRMAAWVTLSMFAVAAGWRFFPRYYFQLLVPAVLLGGRGLILMSGRWRVAALALLLIPAARFGPRYAKLAMGDRQWSDLELSNDSEAAARMLAGRSGTLLVWGYRPDLYALTRMEAGTRFLDSQPLTGVLADRHLSSAEVSYPDLAARNRRELTTTHPAYIVDGLGPLNPALAITRYPDLSDWLKGYRLVGRTAHCVIYAGQ